MNGFNKVTGINIDTALAITKADAYATIAINNSNMNAKKITAFTDAGNNLSSEAPAILVLVLREVQQ